MSSTQKQTRPLSPSNTFPDKPRVAVGAVVIHCGKVLLVQRGQPPAQGLWAVPGGSVELGETLQAAAEREIQEETGIVIQARDPIYTFDMIEKDAKGRIRFHYVIVDLQAEYVSGQLQAGTDAQQARWVTPAELENLPVSPKTSALLAEKFCFGTTEK
jgi:ADP-ribose pyrophosphatase